MQGETIWVGKPSQAAYQRKYILCAFFFWLVVPIAYAWMLSRRLRLTEYEVTDKAVGAVYHYKQSKNRLLELYRIESITLEQPDQFKTNNLGNLYIHSTNKNIPPIIFEAIQDPEDVKAKIEQLIKQSKDDQNIKDISIPILQSP